MADDLNLDEWKEFLTARIEQEKGNEDGALEVFEKLLESNPRNQHLLASRTYSLSRLGRSPDAIAAKLAADYAAAGTELVGDADNPNDWQARLNSMLEEADSQERGIATAGALVAW